MTVWCGISAEKVIGLYLFEETCGQPITVNGDRYKEMICDFVILDLHANSMEGYWLQKRRRFMPHSTQNNGLIEAILQKVDSCKK